MTLIPGIDMNLASSLSVGVLLVLYPLIAYVKWYIGTPSMKVGAILLIAGFSLIVISYLMELVLVGRVDERVSEGIPTSVRLVEAPAGTRYARLNAGARVATGDYLLFLDDHCLFMDDDVRIFPESLKRTYNLLALARGRYRKAFVNGAMRR